MITLVHHPDDDKRLGELLIENLLNPRWLVFRAAVAFVKQSGTKHLAEPIRTFLGWGEIKISVGIDHRGTSVEGLTGLLDASGEKGEVFVFHNRNRTRSTFHPKVYLFINDNAAECLIGSGNLTEGGLFTNYEAFFHVSLDKNQQQVP
jgi:HKD family nuclease